MSRPHPSTHARSSWDRLRVHGQRLADASLRALILADPARTSDFALRVGPVYANFSRQSFDRAALAELLALLEARQAMGRVRALFDGEAVNATEQRAALHTALRADLVAAPAARNAHALALAGRQRMREVIATLVAGGVTDVVSVGIGGSDLGPRLAVDALAPPRGQRMRVHFLSNVDGGAAQRLLAGLDPASTAALLISKSFATEETLLNGTLLRDWLGDDTRLYAVTARGDRAAMQFAIPTERCLPMYDWIGGRYSLWSAAGLPIALAVGMERYEAMLAGAAEMDAHVLATPLPANLAAWHALTAVWNRNARGLATHAVMPYDDRLKLLPHYLQQLVMESLGKAVQCDGAAVIGDTVPVWWGGVGTDSQHSFFQALHQGTQTVPIDFIGVIRGDGPHADHHRALLANLLAQTEALANGQASDDPHRAYAGNRPSTLLLLDALTPQALGALLALYEHSVYLQAQVWGINAFDQFGVELGKQLARRLLPVLAGEHAAEDPVTQAVLDEFARVDGPPRTPA